MSYALWQPGTTIKQPVYLDANVIVSFLISGHRLNPRSAKLFGDLFSAHIELCISTIALDESLWAIAKISFADMFSGGRQPPRFSVDSYTKNSSRILGAYYARFTAVSSFSQAMSGAGLSIELHPKTEPNLDQVLNLVPVYMRDFDLTPADAQHLATAQVHAQTFITADRQLAEVFQRGFVSQLTILHLT